MPVVIDAEALHAGIIPASRVLHIITPHTGGWAH
jgi:NAD(P)H-hydrate repair Nnr-like enzyme with NAD(P)H-hydrate dehydratase domain